MQLVAGCGLLTCIGVLAWCATCHGRTGWIRFRETLNPASVPAKFRGRREVSLLTDPLIFA